MVISMKSKKIFIALFTVVLCSAFFFFVSLFYLNMHIEKNKDADAEVLSEPYSAVPTNSGLLFRFEDGKGCLVYLDFEGKSTVAMFCDGDVVRVGKYTADYTVDTDYYLFAGIIDRLGGIDLEYEGEMRRCTGMQAAEILSLSSDTRKTGTEILYAIFDKISKNGFSKDDFVYIIKNGGTDLLVPDCFYWEDQMAEIAQNFEVIS